MAKYQQLQHARDQKDPYQAQTAASSRKTAEGIEKLYNEVVKRQAEQKGGLVGPP